MEELIEIPNGVKAEITNSVVKISGKFGSVERRFDPNNTKLEKNENSILLKTLRDKKADKTNLYTTRSHVKNMIHGVKDNIKYQMKIIYSHFPVTAEVKDKVFIIKNFLGEKANRKANVLDGVKITINGREITLEGADIEKVSQTAANIEQAAKIIKKDRRVFQDGIYIIEKDGVPIK